MRVRYSFALMYICVLSLFCVHPVSAESTSDPIIVGVIHSKTHPSAESMKKSFEMAVEAKNEEGGVRGRSLQIVYADDGLGTRGSIGYQHGDEERAVKSLIDRGAVMLMGGYSSANTIHTAHLAEKFGIPFLVTTAADDQITQRQLKNVFRLNPPAEEYARGLEEILRNKAKPKSMVIVYEASPYGTGIPLPTSQWDRNRPGLHTTHPYNKMPRLLAICRNHTALAIIVTV